MGTVKLRLFLLAQACAGATLNNLFPEASQEQDANMVESGTLPELEAGAVDITEATEAPVSTDAPPANPYQEGCLRSFLGADVFPNKRICNSDDPDDAAGKGLCDAPAFDYNEIRIQNQNWEAPMYSSWVMQILLSELLGVPTSIETSSPDRHYNFYDPGNPEDASTTTYPWESLEMAHEVGDCRKVKSKHQNDDEYQTCAHVFPMVSKVGQAATIQEYYHDGTIAKPRESGAAEQYRWWIPLKLAKQDPSLQSYLGIQGESNRRLLAELFLRPTTWHDYCKLVSLYNCATSDGIAARAPDEDEAGKYFVDGLYTGHFRATEKNDCEANPDTCTGHIVNVICEWNTFVVQQAHHLNIAVESDGDLPPNGGYGYSSILEIYAAANATGSNVMLYWWEPDTLIERFRGTEYEFTPIYLPSATTECLKYRVSPEERCSSDFEDQIGSPGGSCEASVTSLVTLLSLDECEDVESGSCSPAYETLQGFEITNLDLQEIYSFRDQDPNQDGRLAVCKWFAQNLDVIKQTFIPNKYPRESRDEAFYQPLTYTSITIAVITMICVSVCVLATKRLEKTKVMVYAQVDFLLLILGGLFLVGGSAVLYSIAPTKAVCVSRQWFYNVGYSLELIPLAVKVAATNRILHAGKKMKRVKINKQWLHRVVGGCIFLVCLFLAVWTAVDPAIPQTKTTLIDDSVDDKYIVQVSTFCESSSSGWQLASMVYISVLLLVSAAIATQNRGAREEFNETRYLALMIYSHFMFTILRLIVFLFKDKIALKHAVSASMSLLLSVDTLITIGIYFLPKLFAAKEANFQSMKESKLQSIAPSKNDFLSTQWGFSAEDRSSNPNLQETSANADNRSSDPNYSAHLQESTACADQAAQLAENLNEAPEKSEHQETLPVTTPENFSATFKMSDDSLRSDSSRSLHDDEIVEADELKTEDNTSQNRKSWLPLPTIEPLKEELGV